MNHQKWMASALDAKFPATADKTSFTPNRPGFSSREYMPALSTGVPVAFNLSPSFLPYVNNQQDEFYFNDTSLTRLLVIESGSLVV
jgi:hypothetical protein